MSRAALSDFTVTSPAASMLAKSVTFRIACAALGVHMPAEQLMCLVLPSEILTSARAAPAQHIAADTRSTYESAREPRVGRMKSICHAPLGFSRAIQHSPEFSGFYGAV